jgi:uncharacterized protein (DUF2342 family)
MNSLLDEIARSLGLRRSNSQTKPAEIQVQLVDIQGRMADFEHRLVRMETAFNEFVVAFQRKLSDLARRGAQARQQAVDELEVLRRDLDTYIDILEKSVEGQLDMARRQDLRRLLASARAKRTRISNVIALKAANDG